MTKRTRSKKANKTQNNNKNKKEKKLSSVPVTILSGFLGSGKTTLLRHILTSKDHGLKIAVIVNDMAELNVDAQIINKAVVVQTKPEIVTLENGCICCNLRGDLIREIYRIQQSGKFDYVMIESTGIAEPQQVAESFCVDPETMALAMTENGNNKDNNDDDNNNIMKKEIENEKMLLNAARLDTCTTVVDALHFPKYLSSLDRFKDIFKDGLGDAEAQEGEKSISELVVEQVEFANVILLNKIDLVSEKELQICKDLIKSLNPKAQLITSSYGKIDVNKVLNTGLFNLEEAIQSPGWLLSIKEHGVDGAPSEAAEYGVSSFVYRSRTPFHPLRLSLFLKQHFCFAEDWNLSKPALEEMKQRISSGEKKKVEKKYGSILRSKGICWIAGRDQFEIEWAQSGNILQFHPTRPWYCLQSKEEWEPESKKELEEIESNFYNINSEGEIKTKCEFGDRRQEIVFIGTELQKDMIEKALQEASLTDDEMKKHNTDLVLGAYPDPLMPGLIFCDDVKNLFMILRSGQNQHLYIPPGFSCTLQNLGLFINNEEAGISAVRVWLDKSSTVESGILLATLRPKTYEQHTMSISLLPCDNETGGEDNDDDDEEEEEAMNRRIRMEVVLCPNNGKKLDSKHNDYLMTACEVHVVGTVEPLPYSKNKNNGHDHEEGNEECETGRCDH